MSLELIVTSLGLTLRSEAAAGIKVTAGYASDLLSDVLGNAKSGAIWVTNQKHQNVIGVAVMLNLAAVVIAGGVEPDENTLAKAAQERVPLYTTNMSAFETVGKLWEMGVKG